MKSTKFIFIFVFLLLVSSICVNALLTDNIISYWKMDESSGNAIDSVSSNTGINTNVSYAIGKINNAGIFNKTAKFTIADNSALKPEGNFSVSFWLKTSDNDTVNLGGVFQSYNQLAKVSGFEIIKFNNQKLWFTVGKNKGVVDGVDFASAFSTNTINDGIYHFYTCVNNGTHLVVYTDGIIGTPTAYSGNAKYEATNYVGIGVNTYGGVDLTKWNGSIDELGFWNRTLTSLEITNLYNGGTGLSYPFITSYIQFNLPMPSNDTYYNSTHNYIETNITTVYPNLINSTIFLYKNDVLVNSIANMTGNFTYNFTGLTTEIYKINATAYNSTENISTETRTIYINKGQINITAYNQTGNLINVFQANINGVNYNTSSGIIYYQANIGDINNITINASNYAYDNGTIQINSTLSVLYNRTLYLYNSIRIYSFLESTNTAVSINATLDFLGTSNSFTNIFNGTNTNYSNIPDDTYTITVTSGTYSIRKYVVSVTNGSTQILNIYMVPNASIIGIYTKSLTDNIISGATITIQELINTSYIGVTQGITDGTGFVTFALLEGKSYRLIISADNFNVYQTDLIPYSANSPYTFKLAPSSSFQYTTLSDYVKYYYSPVSTSLNTSNQSFNFTTYSINGSIQYTYIKCNSLVSNVSGSPLGSTVSVTLNVTPNVPIYCMFALSTVETGFYSFNVTYTYLASSSTSVESSAKYIKDNTQEIWLTLLSYFIMLIIAIGIKKKFPDNRITGVILCVGTIVFVSLGWINWIAGGVSATIGLLMLYMGSR